MAEEETDPCAARNAALTPAERARGVHYEKNKWGDCVRSATVKVPDALLGPDEYIDANGIKRKRNRGQAPVAPPSAPPLGSVPTPEPTPTPTPEPSPSPTAAEQEAALVVPKRRPRP